MKDFHSLITKLLKIFKSALIIFCFYFLPVILVLVFLILYGVNLFLKQQTDAKALLPSLQSIKGVDYTQLNTVRNINISAKSAIVMDDVTKVVIYAKNPNVRFSPASTTKLMTALVGLTTYKPEDILTVKGPLDSEGSGLGLIPGQKISFLNLLYGMFLPSANDAAQTVAQNYPSGEQAFIARMNETARTFHLNHTHFGDPAGLNDDNDYTTVTELARLTSILLQYPLIRDIVKQKFTSITTADKTQTFSLKNRNILLGSYGINGVKTGYTDEANGVLVTSVSQDQHTLIVIVMNSDDRFGDTLELVRNIIPEVSFTNFSF